MFTHTLLGEGESVLLIWKLNHVTHRSRQTDTQIDSSMALSLEKTFSCLCFCFTLPVVAWLACQFVMLLLPSQWRGLFGANSSADWQTSLLIFYAECWDVSQHSAQREGRKSWSIHVWAVWLHSTDILKWFLLVNANSTGRDLSCDCKMGNLIKNECQLSIL